MPEPLCEADKNPCLCSTQHAAKTQRNSGSEPITESAAQINLRGDVWNPYVSDINVSSQAANV